MRRRALPLILLLALTMLLSACGRNMFDQPRADALQASAFFADGSANRPQIEGTVSRERGAIDPEFFGGPNLISTSELPLELSLGLLQRGQERFNIYCTPCHNYNGDGEGVVVQRGFPQPASLHEQRLLDAPVGYYMNAMTNGFGRMFSYASRIPAEDRWAIAAYIKALQLSQNAFLDDVPDEARQRLEGLEVNS